MPKQFRRKNRLDEADLYYADTTYEPPSPDYFDFARHAGDAPVLDGPPSGDRWSTWDQSSPLQRGPLPYPAWLVTEHAAVDTEHGVLKTGKEADVHVITRGIPDTDRSCLLAAKRFRSGDHRLFHRDAGYLEGRRVRESRVNRAMASRTDFGKKAIAGLWANAEFTALCRLYLLGAPVPYPVQILGTEVLEEFIGEADGHGAPRLTQVTENLPDLWDQLVEAMVLIARDGLAHGDLSAYNILVHHGRLVIIDLPQIVDVISNPEGPAYLDRDAHNVATWFSSKGLRVANGDELAALLRTEARLE